MTNRMTGYQDYRPDILEKYTIHKAKHSDIIRTLREAVGVDQEAVDKLAKRIKIAKLRYSKYDNKYYKRY